MNWPFATARRFMQALSHSPRAWGLWAAVWLLGAALCFYWPALAQTGGTWPAPLDDSYIYYDFARTAARGYPGQWLAGNGYSSGATSPLYPLLLAPLWALGLRGHWLGLGAALLALICLFDLSVSLRATLTGQLAQWLAPVGLVALPLLNWSWFSGMELALFGAICGRALRSCQQAMCVARTGRTAAQWRAGIWLSLLVLARPEAVALVLTLTLAVAHAGRSLRALGSLVRTGFPALGMLAGQAMINQWLTGEIEPAGALRKLVAHDPWTTVSEDAIEVAKNLLVLLHQALLRAWGGWPWIGFAALLWWVAMGGRRHRRLARACIVGALAMTVLVALNSTARFQNYRYAAPAILLGCVTLAMGVDTLRRRPLLALLLGVGAILAPLGQWPRQQRHFARASRNIAEQHGVVARKLMALDPAPQRVLLGDAGAIPYLSDLPALDGLGLGGYHKLPFARASRHGVGCVVELIERLPASERPDVMALYPDWWPGLVSDFGERIDSVRILDNVICAADEKVIYRSDWSTLGPPPAATQHAGELRLDVADLLDEREHNYRFEPPRAGRVITATLQLEGQLRWDAGRHYPAGTSEAFRLPAGTQPGPYQLQARTDGAASVLALRAELWRGGQRVHQQEVAIGTAQEGSWRQVMLQLPAVQAGDDVVLSGGHGSWRSYQLWLRPLANAALHAE